MIKRPLICVLSLVVLWILFFYDPPNVISEDTDNITIKAKVEEMSGTDGDTELVVGDISTDNKKYNDLLFQKSLKIYAAVTKDSMLPGTAQYKTSDISETNDQKSFIFSGLKIGNTISIRGKIKAFRPPGNPGQFDEIQYYSSLGISARMFASEVKVLRDDTDLIADMLYRIRGFFRNSFYKALPEEHAGIICAMVLGEKAGLSEEVKELYRENGIAHVLAISGLHISLIGMGLFFLLRKTIFPFKISAFITSVILVLYGELTGFPIATKRAVIMCVILMISKIVEEKYDSLNALSIAALFELVTHPISLYQSGFLLSYGTVLGIILFVSGLSDRKKDDNNVIISALYTGFKGSAGIFIVTLPIMVQCYHEVAVFSIPMNMILLPFMSLLLGVSLFAGGVGMISVYFSNFLYGAIYYILCLYRYLCEFIVSIPWHMYITGQRAWWRVVIYYGCLLGLVYFRKNDYPGIVKRCRLFIWINRIIKKHPLKKPVIIISIIVLNIFAFLYKTDDEGLTVTCLDIGQGDCICIRYDDKTILVDGGSSDVKDVAKYRIVPYLKYIGEDRIDAMIISHSDADHVNGFSEILKKKGHFGLEIRQVIMPEIKNADDNYIQFMHEAKEAGVPVRLIDKGDEIEYGEMKLTCIHPEKEYEWEDANDYSTVLMVGYRAFRGLLTGDLGFHGEEAVEDELPDVDFLKVGHHGSKNSTSEAFLQRIRPEIAFASAGYKNRYHHPSAETLDRLKNAKVKTWCTIDGGALTIKTDGKSMEVITYK